MNGSEDDEGVGAAQQLPHCYQFTRRSHDSPVFLKAAFPYAINASSKRTLSALRRLQELEAYALRG